MATLILELKEARKMSEVIEDAEDCNTCGDTQGGNQPLRKHLLS